MSNPRIALVTCDQFPQLDEDDVVLIAALAKEGMDATVEIWDDKTVDWATYDQVIIRSTWDYAPRRDEFVSWAKSVPNLSNPANIVEWNTDKYYLKELGEAGIPIVKTLWLDPERHFTSQAIHTRLPAFGDYVIKPSISAGAQDTARYQGITAKARGEAILQVRDLLRDGKHVMIQPYLTQIDSKGETSLIFIDGTFSHAVRKTAMLARGDAPGESYQQEELALEGANLSYKDFAEKVMEVARATINNGETFLFARVDLIPNDDGEPVLLELELTEPTLFLKVHPGAEDMFAQAVARRLKA